MDLAVETPARCSVYRRRRPERTPLYRAVQGHLETYLALARKGHSEGTACRGTWRGSFAATSNAASWPTASHALAAKYEQALPLAEEYRKRAPQVLGGHLSAIMANPGLGRTEDAHGVLGERLQIRPDFSIGLVRKRVQRQFRLDPEPLERFVKLLRQAGMPEESPAAAQGKP